MKKPVLAITMGDPAGIGPEIIVGAWAESRIHERVRPVVIGNPGVLRRAARLLGFAGEVSEIPSAAALDGLHSAPDYIPCIQVWGNEVVAVRPGVVDAQGGEAAFQAIRLAAKLAIEKRVAGIVTAPLNKAALHAAGRHYPGHTELLAEMCDVTDFAMMLYLPPGPMIDSAHGLGVVHVTLHQSLRSVFDDLTPAAIAAKCRLAHDAMRRLGVERPRLAVCALNPHAGEDGLFGNEERIVISPAVDDARRSGLEVSGPYPTDTLLLRARHGEFDAVIAMYHDQGHIALKLLGLHAAVNITLGLPIVRTSVAHGTAFDRAWQGTARCDGMVAAVLTAARLIRGRT
jgi:4-hydroxythreonine-4-phosphate dehydrogenase